MERKFNNRTWESSGVYIVGPTWNIIVSKLRGMCCICLFGMKLQSFKAMALVFSGHGSRTRNLSEGHGSSRVFGFFTM